MVKVYLRICCWLLLFPGLAVHSQSGSWNANGDVKYRLINSSYPADSLLRPGDSSRSIDHTLSLRYNLEYNNKAWQAEASYQVAGFYGDSLRRTDDLPGLSFFSASLPDDANRLFDLTSQLSRQSNRAALHRLDRLAVSYRTSNNVIKFGRQAVSWGNGLAYAPMDLFNPFDPAAIDTEYKAGDDMLYLQHLFDNGSDLQMVSVGRRDAAQQTSSEVNSIALKLHGFAGQNEYDLLLADHYQDTVLALGGIVTIGGSILRGDWVYSDTDDGGFNNIVANLSYAWMAWGKNVSGFVEYFHNDFGIGDGNYSIAKLQTHPQLLKRLSRGELFTVAKDYLAASATVEMAPLWTLTPNIFYNMSDQSGLWQLLSQHSLSPNRQLVIALSLPVGPVGSEYGGVE
ncbi:MAG: hypothetical protein KJP04_05875, partial [Arenicella sp.]|nr:hypothetical protein [Arenicella sp.]